LADTGGVQIKDDRREGARSLRTDGEARLAAVLRLHDHVVFDHGLRSTAGPSLTGMTGQLLGMTRGRLYSVADVRCICTCRRRRPKQSPLGVAKGGPHAIAPRRVAD